MRRIEALLLATLLAVAGAAAAQEPHPDEGDVNAQPIGTEHGEPLEAADERTDDGEFESIQEDPSDPEGFLPWYTFVLPLAFLALALLVFRHLRRGHGRQR